MPSKSRRIDAKPKPDRDPGKFTFGSKRFGELLIEDGVISEEQLAMALERQVTTGERVGEALVNSGLVSEPEIARALSRQLGIAEFVTSSVAEAGVEVILTIPEQLARRHHVIAVGRTDDVLTVAMVDPLDLVAIDDVRVSTNCELEIQVGCRVEIDDAISRAYESATAGQNLEDAIEGAKVELGIVDDHVLTNVSEEELRNEAEEAPIIRLVDLMLAQAISERATDIHIEPLNDMVVVRYRIDGVLYDTLTPPKRFRDAIVVRVKILSNMDVAERRIPLDGRFTARSGDREVDVRVSSLPTVYGEKLALRLLDKSTFSADIQQLGFETEMLEAFRKALRKPYGMVLISGPTGSGKTTSLYAGLSELDRTGKNITTLEDPVEYHLSRINQVSINTRAGLSFATGLRALLRQDPDIIMIGEIRDLETAELAVRSALTGHLVLSTVHANDAPSTLTRLVDVGIEPFLATSAVHLVMAQRLVRKICPECKTEYTPDPKLLASLGADRFKNVKLYRGEGCAHCKGRGYRGRMGVYELLEVTPEIAELVLERASSDAIRQRAIKQGLVTLSESAIRKVLDGSTTVEEVLAVVSEGE